MIGLLQKQLRHLGGAIRRNGVFAGIMAAAMGSADAAKVAPVFTNDTSANTLSFNDSFGHDVVMGSYNPGTGAWMPVGGGGGGAGSFASLTVSGNATIGGTLGVAGLTTVGPLTATGVLSGVGFTNLFASPPPIGNVAANSGAFTALSATGAISGAGFTSYLASPPAIGSTAPSTGAFTTLSASGGLSGAGFTNLFASPPAIGSTAANTGAFTTLSASGATTLAALSATGAVSGVGFTNLFASPPPIGATAANSGKFTTLSATGLNSTPIGGTVASTGSFTSLASSGTVSGTGFTAYLASPPAIGGTAANSGKFTTLTESTQPAATDSSTNAASTAWYASLQNFRSLQSFGAKGDGVTNDTVNFTTAVNSGAPLTCNGSFLINGLVTITNVNWQMMGLGGLGCKILLSTNQSMLYATETQGNVVHLENVNIVPQAAITSVTGPAKTAALFVTYPSGTNGYGGNSVILKNVQIINSASGNYAINGVYLNDATGVEVDNYVYNGDSAAFQSSSAALVFDGTHSPTTLTVQRALAVYAGTGIYAPAQTTNGWQGIRVANFDCVQCYNGAQLVGAADGKSDYVSFTNSTMNVQNDGVYIQDAGHAQVTGNYVFLGSIALSGAPAVPAFPTCFYYGQTVAVGVSYGGINYSGNTCNGVQEGAGYTGRIGVAFQGRSSAESLNAIIGPNTLKSLDTGISTGSTADGIVLFPQATQSVTTPWSNASVAGAVTPAQSYGRTDGQTSAAGQVGEVVASTILVGAPVSLVTGVAKTITSISLTAGHWTCYGNVGFAAGAGAVMSVEEGSISATTNAINITPPGSFFFETITTPAAGGELDPLNTSSLNLTSTTTEYLTASAQFSGGTMSGYGFIECQRTL